MGQRTGGGVVVVVKKLALALLAGVMAGCSAQSQPPILTPVQAKVAVAVPVYCEAGKLDRPALPSAALKTDSAL
jgi:hypothetical protein